MPSLVAGLMYLVLLCPDEGTFVDIGMYFDIGVVRELKGIPLAVVDYHCGGTGLVPLLEDFWAGRCAFDGEGYGKGSARIRSENTREISVDWCNTHHIRDSMKV